MALDLLTQILDETSIEIPSKGISFSGSDPILPTPFRVGDAAAAALGASALAASAIHELRTGQAQDINVDVQGCAVSLISFLFQKLNGEELLRTSLSNPTVDLYQAGDGRWVHLHGGFPNLEAGILSVLNCSRDKEALTSSVVDWNALELEDALAQKNLCGAAVRTNQEWLAHPQGQALSLVPLVEVIPIGESDPIEFSSRSTKRPLSGIKVLDLTRVLAGPACGRTLAMHGAEVLNISGPSLPSVETFVVDTGHGKRSAFLDLNKPHDMDKLFGLTDTTDVFCQSFRPGHLAKRGLGPEALAERRPGIIYVSINCYGHTGPWADRAGWEQLAQTVSGIAHESADDDGKPRLLPAAATDYTTGYLAAYGAIVGLMKRAQEGGSYHVRVSLSRTARWLLETSRVQGPLPDMSVLPEIAVPNLFDRRQTLMGELTFLKPPLAMSATQPHWVQPPEPLGASPPVWQS